ncbi:procathepsin L-like [Clupea harengus]|uniref:Procathepsin L-like n=1 Tax=Clupea harengus TaxID=7950 RepID=A0A6P8GKM8_CLUHA|nr:procathepsin L-like [Clupea harengus]
MRLLIIAAASLAVVSCASLSLEDLEFHAWKLKFEKSYSSLEEEAHRKKIWLSTRRRVLTHNILVDQGIKTYRMGMNQFSDMDSEEYSQTVLLRNMIPSNETKAMPHRGTITSKPKGGTAKLSASVNWRDNGCVTPVKNQGHCGSCWAFSTTGALESHTCINYGYLPSLSEQQLVDCSGSYGNNGCNGGRRDPSFQYVIDNGGIDTEAYYPYEAKDDNCRFKPSDVCASCRGYTKVKPPGNESALQEAVANEGPVSVAIDAEQDFRFYESGVYNEPSCSRTRLNHAMLVMGYGTEDGLDYWLVKNSWSASWGEEGYIKMSRNQDNQCGIASYAFYPEV